MKHFYTGLALGLLLNGLYEFSVRKALENQAAGLVE